MTASSAVVLSNLAYLIGAVVLATIGGLIVWLYHRHPKSIYANVESFHRGLRALAPDGVQAGSGRPAPPGVRIQPPPAVEPEAAAPEATAPEVDSDAGVVVPINGWRRPDAPDPERDPAGPWYLTPDLPEVMTDPWHLAPPAPILPPSMDEAASERRIERRAGAETG
jgi:hypothetical protein